MIYLYENVTPNRGQNTHYVFSNLSNYVTAIAAASTNTTSFAEDSYRINSGVCMIYYNTTATESPVFHLYNITYLRHVYTDKQNNTVTTFYHVTRAEMEAGYIRLYLTRDDWATNYLQSKQKNLFIEKCNSQFSTSYAFPDFERVKGSPTLTTKSLIGTINSANLAIVYVVSHAANTNVSPLDSPGAKFSVFASQLNRITDNQSIYADITFDQILERIGGIRGVVGSWLGLQTEKDAQIVQAFIVPKAALKSYITEKSPGVPFDYTTDWITDVEFTSRISSGDFHFSPVFACAPNIYTVSFSHGASLGYDEFFGTRFTQLKIPKQTIDIPTYCAVHFATNSNGIQVILQVGETVQDISDQFTVSLTYNNGGVNATDAQKRAIQQGLAAIGIGASIASGDATFARIAGLIGSSFGQSLVSTPHNSISGGDAALNFYNGVGTPESATYYKNPFYVAKYESAENESEKIGAFGAIFNRFYSTTGINADRPLTNIPSFAVVGSSNTLGTFVRGQMCVSGIQSDAAQFMENELAGGIYVKAV